MIKLIDRKVKLMSPLLCEVINMKYVAFKDGLF